MKFRKKIFSTAVFGVIMLMIGACGASEKENQPKSNGMDVTSQELTAQRVYIDFGGEGYAEMQQGDVFAVSSNDTTFNFDLKVRRVQESMPGFISISAYVENEETGQAALQWREKKFTGRIDLFDQGKQYRVAYDSTKSTHYVEEVIPDSLDELEGGEALTPERKALDQ